MSLGRRSAPARWSIRWPVVLALAGAILVLLAISAGRETYRTWKINGEIQHLQAQVNVLEGKKLHILDTIQQLGSSETLDREARLRLGLKKPGERVIIVKGIERSEYAWQESLTTDTVKQEGPTADAKERSNPQKWFHYFFSPSP
jgi:cell division protein FtsB